MTTRSPHTCLLKEEPEVELKSRSHLRAFLQHRLYFSFNHLSLALLLSWISIPFSSQFLQEWSLRIPPQGSMRVPMEMQIPGSCSRTVISIFLILEKLNIFNLRLRRFLIKCSSFFFYNNFRFAEELQSHGGEFPRTLHPAPLSIIIFPNHIVELSKPRN